MMIPLIIHNDACISNNRYYWFWPY